MNYTIHYHSEISKDIFSIPRNIQSRVRKAIEQRLLRDPIKYGEPLKRSLQGYRKIRVGDYRIIYRVQSHEIIVLKIGHRKEVYKKDRKEGF